MLRLSAQINDQLRHAVTQLAPDPGVVVPPTWLVTVADWCWDDPELPEFDWAVDDSWAASTTEILPPNWKALFLTWDLFLTKVAVSHEQVWAAARLLTLMSGVVVVNEPVDASAFEVWVVRAAYPSSGSPAPGAPTRLQTHPSGGLPPGGVPGPSGMVQLKWQSDGMPKSPGLKTWTSSSVCKRDLRVLAWEVARRSPRVIKVAFIILIYF